MPVLYTNNATSTLNAGITNVATSLTVAAGQGARFPAISGSNYFYATLVNSSGTIEIVKVTARATDTLTIVRAQDGTTAVAWNAGDRIEVRVTKAMLDDLKADARAGAFTSNLSFSGTGLRITGDFHNATIASRVLVQSSATDSQTLFGLLPSGTAVSAQYHLWGASDPTNAPLGAFIINSTSVRLHSTASGTGTVLPLQFWMGASESARFSTAGNFLLGGVTDNATDKLQVTGSMSLSSALRVGASPSAGTTGQVLTSAGAGAAPTWSAAASASLQEFSSSGTWTKPSNATFVMAEVWAGGGGGGSGYRASAGLDRAGGSGGGGGAYGYRIFKASDLPATVTVTIGSGGAGGAAVTVDSTVGNDGVAGGNTSFGNLLTVYGGSGGNGGSGTTTTAPVYGGGQMPGAYPRSGGFGPADYSVSSLWMSTGFGGGNGGGKSNLFGQAGGGSYQGGSGGGGGGGINSGNSALNSAAGGSYDNNTGGGGIGSLSTVAGVAGATRQGGGGGSVLTTANGDVWPRSVAFANGRLVVTTYAGLTIPQNFMLTSTDNGTTWSWVATPTSLSANYSVISVGSTFYFFSNSSDMDIWSTTDFSTWTKAGRTPATGGGIIPSYANGIFFICGDNNIQTSTDLYNWTTRYTHTQGVYRVVWTGTNYVAAAGNVALYSTNLTSWSSSTGLSGGFFRQIACNGATVVVQNTGTSPYTFYSTNHGQTFAGSTTATGSYPDVNVTSLQYLGGSFVLGTNVSSIYTSTDGNTWTLQTDPTTDNYGAIAYTGTTWFIGSLATNTTVGITSTNLTTWTARTAPTISAGSGAGSAGGTLGGGGGGGAASVNGTASGSGGAGGNGFARIYTW